MDVFSMTYPKVTKIKVTSVNDNPFYLAKAPVQVVIRVSVWPGLETVAWLPSRAGSPIINQAPIG